MEPSVSPMAPAGIDTIEVRSGGLVADLFVPAGPGPHPAVLLVGGSSGGIGWQRYMAQLLAERGIAALALAYFGLEGLLPELDRVPLEYVEHALTWLRLQPNVDSTRVGIGGVSKGGELALLIASLRPELRAVAAFVPSGVVFQSIAEGFPSTSSWTHRGREVPYVAYGTVESPRSIGDFYRAGLEQTDSIDAATIRVENINGPVLLLSGESDTLWPSASLSAAVLDRLRAHGFAHAVEHVAYPDAGHLISSIYPDDEDPTGRGGTEAGNRHAQVDGQRRFLEFFERTLLR